MLTVTDQTVALKIILLALWYVAETNTRSPGFISSSRSTVTGSVSKR